MRTKLSAAIAIAVLFGGQGIPEAHSACSTKNISVEASKRFNATGIHASPGESFLIIAANGTVDLATDIGGYRTGPDGTIAITPPADSKAFRLFRDQAVPLFTDPVKGSRKSLGLPGHLRGGTYGALVAGFSPKPSPSSFGDFPAGFTLIGTRGIARSPNTGGYLFLGVNDSNNTADNAGTFRVTISCGGS